MNTENMEMMQDRSEQENSQMATANSNGNQPEPFNAKKYAIDKSFETAKEGIQGFNQKHPGAGKKIVGATLIAAGATVLMI